MPYDSVPFYDMSDNETGCCPRFNAKGWDGLELHFDNKLFVHARTHAVFHVPIDMGKVFPRVQAHLEAANAFDPDNFFILSKDLGAWTSEHFFTASRDVAGEEMVRLSGDYVTKVFDGPYADAKQWYDEMKAISAARGKPDGEVYFYYTTCPKCAKHYGHNYIVGFAEV
jgi:Bacterial hydrolase